MHHQAAMVVIGMLKWNSPFLFFKTKHGNYLSYYGPSPMFLFAATNKQCGAGLHLLDLFAVVLLASIVVLSIDNGIILALLATRVRIY